MALDNLWVERYRPKTVDEYVFTDPKLKETVNEWIATGQIGNIILSGGPGTGKTTLAKVLVNELGISEYDFMEINASRTNSVEDVRDKISNFAQMIPFGGFKVILLDEADFLSHSAQAALRGVFEAYHMNARFILTCNYKNRLIAPLHSRCQHIQIEKPDITEFTARVATILMTENVDFDLDTLDTYVRATYPDLRKCINNLQMNSLKGKLQSPDNTSNESADYRIAVFDLFKQGKIGEARKLLCDQARAEEMEDIYTWMYKNIHCFGATEQQQDNAVLIIKQGLVDHTICADSEINLSATLIRLARNME